MQKSPTIDIHLNFSHFKSFALNQKENNTSSLSRLHYGHMRTLVQDDELLRLRFDILSLALRHNVVLDRWRKIWEMLLPKEAPRNFIHRFRNISIIEWDVQYLMKTIWAKRLMSRLGHLLYPSQNTMAGKVP